MSDSSSLTDLDIGPDGRFQNLFTMLSFYRTLYILCLKQVTFVDDTYLNDCNKGILFVAKMKDNDEQVFPMAYEIG